MKKSHGPLTLLQVLTATAGLPSVVILLGDFQARSVLKDILSFLTILSFCLLVGQFFWCMRNRGFFGRTAPGTLIRFHNLVGYLAVVTILLHPLFLVLPRVFERGMDPWQAFGTIVTTASPGIISGLISWGLLLVLGLTSFFRRSLAMGAGTWKRLHGLLALIFLITSTYHVLDLGRHSGGPVSVLFVFATALALLLYCRQALRVGGMASRKRVDLDPQFALLNSGRNKTKK